MLGASCKDAQQGVDDCPQDLVRTLDGPEGFLLNIDKTKKIAEELKTDSDKYTTSELRAKVGDPIGSAQAHCTDQDEIAKFSKNKCRFNDQEIDMQEAKKQCEALNKIFLAAHNLPDADTSKPSQRNDDDKKKYQDLVQLIVDGFAK